MEKISIELPAQAWNVVLNALAHRPYVEVADLLLEIKRQGEIAVKSLGEVKDDQVMPS